MRKEVIEIDIETGKAQTNLEDVSKKIDNVADSVEKVGKEAKEGIEKIADSSKKTAKGVKRISKAFKAVGTAIKAAGIGLLLAGLAQLKEIFEQNQKVADLFNTTFEVLSIAFNDFANFITNNIGEFTGFFKAIFDETLPYVFGQNSRNPYKTIVFQQFDAAKPYYMSCTVSIIVKKHWFYNGSSNCGKLIISIAFSRKSANRCR